MLPLLICVVLCGLTVFGQSRPATARISGIVTDDCGDPIRNAVVTLTPVSARPDTIRTESNEDGEFLVAAVRPGKYLLRAELKGAKPHEIDARAGRDLHDIFLRVDFGLLLCHSIPRVSTSRSESPGSLELKTVDASVCELARRPAAFNGTMIRVRARIEIGVEDFKLSDACTGRAIDAIWLEYGRGPKKQPAIWCCGDLTPRDSLNVVGDAEFRKFDELLTKSMPVVATLVGRFDSTQPVAGANGQEPYCSGAFGHLGVFCARIVIQSVSNVEAVKK